VTYDPLVRALLRLVNEKPVRAAIRANHNRTLLYAGTTMRQSAYGTVLHQPMWKEILELKRQQPQYSDMDTLPDVLARVKIDRKPYATLLAYVQDVEAMVAWHPDGFYMWRMLSAVFAGNATGRVSFYIGSGVSPDTKVFAATELAALDANPNVDELTKDLVAYYKRCVQRGDTAMNLSFLA
jgi:hypothetical protein